MSHLIHSIGSSFTYLPSLLCVILWSSECNNILTVVTICQNKRGSYFWWKFVLKDNLFHNTLSFCTCLCNVTLCQLPSKSGSLELEVLCVFLNWYNKGEMALGHIHSLRGFPVSRSHSLGSEELCKQMWPNVFGNEIPHGKKTT